MAVVLACAHRDFAFLAADSVRWDLVQRRDLGPVEKIHLAGDHDAVATGGTNIYRTALAQVLVAAGTSGESFPAAPPSVITSISMPTGSCDYQMGEISVPKEQR